tara:strand:- start:4228 stop:5490 length:1263 start_codon:yes stop_codon:yes gene_type:complete
MAGVNDAQVNKLKRPRQSLDTNRKPLQVLHISKKEEGKDPLNSNKSNIEKKDDSNLSKNEFVNSNPSQLLNTPEKPAKNNNEEKNKIPEDSTTSFTPKRVKGINEIESFEEINFQRQLDEYDFNETEFLAALNENEPIGSTGEIASGSIIAVESDGVYVDIGGKAPGFMPKKECGLGVITNLKERFPIGFKVEVLVTKEQNADGMVTISSRALFLRKSWETLTKAAKDGEIISSKISGFNRGGLTCDIEGLRGFIPRSQLADGNDYQSLVGKELKLAFLEVNPDSRKLVLSEKKATLLNFFKNLKLGQLIEGKIKAIKPYGFFIDLGGVKGLLHQSVITNGSIRDLSEIFKEGEMIKSVITEIDPEKARISLNTALLEQTPGEILIDKDKIMKESAERVKKVSSMFSQTNIKVDNDSTIN